MSIHTTDSTISRVVRHLMLRADSTPDQLGPALGLSAKTITRRLKGEIPWTAYEVAELARHFEVPVALLYAGEDALFAGVGGEGTFHLDSPLALAA